MKNDLSVSARKLKEASSHLNDLTDKANQSIQMVEEFLSKSCSVGTSTSVSLTIINNGRNKLLPESHLEYKKINAKYRLVTVAYRAGTELKNTAKPLSDCSRDIKLAVIDLLPEFLDVITSQITKQIDSSEIVTESVYDAMCELTGKGE